MKKLQDCKKPKDGRMVSVKMKNLQFRGKIVGQSNSRLDPTYIVECTDSTLPNSTYQYKVITCQLSNIVFDKTEEEMESEYPCKIGDKVIHYKDKDVVGVITNIDTNMPHPTSCEVCWEDNPNELDIQWTNKLIVVN